MDKLENFTTGIGKTKDIYKSDEDGFIIKFFRIGYKIPTIQEQRKILETKRKYFGDYIPETELIEKENGEYVVKQKFIEGKTLAQTDISDLSTETLLKLLDLIKKYLQYHKDQGGLMDVTGYQYYPNVHSELIRKIKSFLKIKQNFLTSTNIMVGEDGNLYMVDICEIIDNRLLGKFKSFCAKPFIKKTVSNLEKVLKDKINFENEYINKELFNTLDK